MSYKVVSADEVAEMKCNVEIMGEQLQSAQSVNTHIVEKYHMLFEESK